MLKFCVVGLTERVTEREGSKKRPGRLDLLAVLPHQGHRHGADPSAFKNMTQHAHGVSAEGSNGHQESDVDTFIFEELPDLRAGIVHNTPHVPQGPHEGVVVF